MLRSLRDSCHAAVDLGIVLMIGIAFVGMTLTAFIVWTLKEQLWHTPTGADSAAYNASFNQSVSITQGFDNAINLLLIAVTIFILAIAISALLLLRGR